VASLFAYGTLEIPAVMEAVSGRRFAQREASVRGFARHRLRGRLYPAAVEAPGERLAGRLYQGVDAATLARLDRFEGAEYERCRVEAELAHGARAPAELYVLAERERGALLPEPWERDLFVARHLAAYLERCAAFRAEEEARRRGTGA
jgi:gamma-glutamylcyclotransferase (GGCT)/AIG2-like uncharacterized protein YtfP